MRSLTIGANSSLSTGSLVHTVSTSSTDRFLLFFTFGTGVSEAKTGVALKWPWYKQGNFDLKVATDHNGFWKCWFVKGQEEGVSGDLDPPFLLETSLDS